MTRKVRVDWEGPVRHAGLEAVTAENPPYGILGEVVETSASFEARFRATTLPNRNRSNCRVRTSTHGGVAGSAANHCPYAEQHTYRLLKQGAKSCLAC
jgi:hypothetical protein